MKKLLVFTVFVAAVAHGQSNSMSAPEAGASGPVATPEATPAPAGTILEKDKTASEPSSILSHVIAGMKSQNNSGRSDDLKATNGRQVEAQQEVWLGAKAAGWGLYGLYASTYNSYKDVPGKTKWTMGDPSVTLVHPNWYVSDDLVVTGKLRRYLPLSDYSDAHGMIQTAYYVDAFYKMPHRQDIYNNVTFRSFTYDTHSLSATKNYVEITTNYTKYFARDFRWGFGHWTQIEQHYGTPNGYSVELTPILDYAPTPKIFMGPRIRMPIMAKGAVYDGPTSASLNQAYFQFFLLANL